MCGRTRILGRRPGAPRRKGGREALVVRLDGDVESLTQLAHELLGLECLASALPPKGQRQSDDDSLDVLLADDFRDAREPVATRGALDHLQRLCDRPSCI